MEDIRTGYSMEMLNKHSNRVIFQWKIDTNLQVHAKEDIDGTWRKFEDIVFIRAQKF